MFFLKRFNNKIILTNFFEISFIGLIITIFFAQIINFFFPLNNYIIYTNLIILALIILNQKKIDLNLTKKEFSIFLIIFLLVFLNIYGSGFSDDIDHYHYSSILNADISNIIWGSNSLHQLFGTSSIWFLGQAYLNFDTTRLQDIHVFNGLILFLFLGIFLSELIKKLKDKEIFLPIIFSLLIFVLIKYTRLKEFGIDRPSYLIFFISIFYYLKYLYNSKIKDFQNHFIIFSLIIISILFIKMTFIVFLLIPILLVHLSNHKINYFDKKYYLIFILLIIYLIKNILISGCLIYPISTSCLDFFPWSSSMSASKLAISAEILNKSFPSYNGSLSSIEYVKNFNWFNTWFFRHKIEIIEFISTIFIVIVFTFLSFKRVDKYKIKNLDYRNLIIILLIILFFSLLLFLIKNPNIRMNHHILIIPMVLIILFYLKNMKIIINKKIFILTIILAIGLNFSKNIKRIHEKDYINNPFENISHKISSQKKYEINNFNYYTGWDGEGPVSNNELQNKKFKKIFLFKVIY